MILIVFCRILAVMKANVKLLRYTPNPEEAVAIAARLCYSPSTIEEISEKLTEEKVKAFIEKLSAMGHHTPFEHISFTFGVEGISRVTTHEMVRHRLASFSQQSQRYIEEDSPFSYITPASIEKDSELKKRYDEFMKNSHELYAYYLSKGVKKEDARFVLPNAKEAKIVVTMNARELMHFFNLRCCNRAQWEIRFVARKMLSLAREVAPSVFLKAGASCEVLGYCPEGSMYCGREGIRVGK